LFPEFGHSIASVSTKMDKSGDFEMIIEEGGVVIYPASGS
jgi:hypothetical protein